MSDVVWPEFYVDPDTGAMHGWDDALDPGESYTYALDTGEGYTYRDMAYDQAGAAHMEIGEYLTHLRWRRDPFADEPVGFSPPWIEDSDGYGE